MTTIINSLAYLQDESLESIQMEIQECRQRIRNFKNRSGRLNYLNTSKTKTALHKRNQVAIEQEQERLKELTEKLREKQNPFYQLVCFFKKGVMHHG